MDERIARLKTSQDALNFAANAHRLGHPELETQALQRAGELRTLEDGYHSPAEQAIAIALYAYEHERSQLEARTFRAHRTRQMLAKHGALVAAERMVLRRQPSKGFEVLEDAGLQELSFESIVDRFPNEFSVDAVEAARARLKGKPVPTRTNAASTVAMNNMANVAPVQDAEALAFLRGFQDPSAWFLGRWLPRYRKTIQFIERALADDRPQDLFEIVWKSVDNHISNAGPGLMKYDTVDEMRDDLIQVIRDIHRDPSAENFEHVIERFEGWKAEGRTVMVPRLLIARAFAGIHPGRYHTTVDTRSQRDAIRWFGEHTGFITPRSPNWAVRAISLTDHMDRTGLFGENVFLRNLFPWFVVEQLRGRVAPTEIPPGHSPRPASAFVELSSERRLVALRHNAVQTALFELLASEFGESRVWTEYPTGTGGYADAIARNPEGDCYLYEVKIADTAVEVVRQAIGQLLEYGFRSGGLEPSRLFIVGEPAIDAITVEYLNRLRNDFNLDIEYFQVALPDRVPTHDP